MGYVEKSKSLSIIHVNTADVGGGAERFAINLHRELEQTCTNSTFYVGYRSTNAARDSGIRRFAEEPVWHLWPKFLRSMHKNRGAEAFHFPQSHLLKVLNPSKVDLIHLHNLHGDYFDLRQLPELTAQIPTVLTLHDEWTFTGHCAYSIECDRWKSGCGNCPDLKRYPAVKSDRTAGNWLIKADIFRQSKLHVVTPSNWMAERAAQSLLTSAIQSIQVIPNGVDQTVFKPGDKQASRQSISVPNDAFMLLFIANHAKTNPFKDFETIRSMFLILARSHPSSHFLLLVIGDEGEEVKIGSSAMKFIPFQKSASTMAKFYQAADLYVHAAKADNFPTVILEALSTGTPVVATDVGGVSEQVAHLGNVDANFATGILTNPPHAKNLANAVSYLEASPKLIDQMGQNAYRFAQSEFDSSLQLSRYFQLYEDVIRTWQKQPS
ncbi:MAG: glycosyltransferase [Chloroflexota bacterium]